MLQREGMPGPEEGDELEEAAAGWSTEGHHHQEYLSGTLSCSSSTPPFSKYFFSQKFTENFQITKLKNMYRKFRLRIF
jgi:hypothetical protein